MTFPFSRQRPLLPAPGQQHTQPAPEMLFWSTVMEINDNLQVPIEMAMAALLGAIATPCQGRYDVELPYGSRKPLSLAILISAISGDRKSALLDHVMSPIRKVEREQRRQHEQLMENYQAERSQWLSEKQAITKAIYRKKTKGASTKKETQELQDHYALMPNRPRRFALLYEDTTAEALFQGLADELPTASLITDEGHTALQSPMFRALGKLNTLWSGGSAIVSRASKEEISLENVRLSMLLMVQPGVLEEYMQKTGAQARESGLWGRFLVCAPQSMQGGRFIDPNMLEQWEAWEQASERLTTLTRKNLEIAHTPHMEREVVRFSESARQAWVKVYNEIEAEMAPGRRYAGCGDHASKLAENIARVAALLHLFENEDEEIGLKNLILAIDIVHYFSEHFQAVFMPPPQEYQDAQLLYQWFQELRQRRFQYIRYNDVRQKGPNALRNKKRLADALSVLESNGEIIIFQEKKTRIINLMPHFSQFSMVQGF